MSHWDFDRQPAEQDAAEWAEDDGWSVEDGWVEGEGTGAYPISYERPAEVPAAPPPPPPPPSPREPWDRAPRPDDGLGFGRWPVEPPADPPTEMFPDVDLNDQLRESVRYGDFDDDRGGDRGARRWLMPVGITLAAAAVGATAVLLTSGHSGTKAASGAATPTVHASSSAAPTRAATATTPAATGMAAAAPLTLAQAQGVLAQYTQTNNAANSQRSATLLATVETGSSYAIDAGFYTEQQSLGAKAYPAFTAAQATYYIPGSIPAGEPKWFVVRVANAFTASPGTVSSNEYLLFTQSAGGAWRDALEPYIMTGASTPQVALSTDGLATAVGPAVTTLATPPGQLATETAASLDGTASGQGAIAIPGRLSDQGDAQSWRTKLPDATVTDTHTAATGTAGAEFALATSNGGALVFYTDAAELTITPPAGTELRLTVPGFYSTAQALTQAGLSYDDQFAVYDPPAGTGAPGVVADFSGITGKN